MTTEILVPQLGFTMTEGTVSEWYVADGGRVTAGELLYSLEVEKAVQDIESPASGVVQILAAQGETFPVGYVLAIIS